MAIIGNIYGLRDFFALNELMLAYEYFLQALDDGSMVHRRIFDLPVGAFEKQQVTDDIFALEQVFLTKNREDCFIESHENYVDFQLVLSGTEQMEYINVDKLDVKTPYSIDKDVTIYHDYEKSSKIVLECGDVAIFYPNDAHVGMPKYLEEELVYKTVLKIPVAKVEGVL